MFDILALLAGLVRRFPSFLIYQLTLENIDLSQGVDFMWAGKGMKMLTQI